MLATGCCLLATAFHSSFIIPHSSFLLLLLRGRVETQRAELLEHRHEVEVVPRLDDLAVAYADDCHARELDRLLGRGKPERVAAVATAHSAARRDLVTLCDCVLDRDLDFRKRLAELSEEWLEPRGPAQRLARVVNQTVRHAFFGEHLVHRLLPPPGPNLLETAA